MLSSDPSVTTKAPPTNAAPRTTAPGTTGKFDTPCHNAKTLVFAKPWRYAFLHISLWMSYVGKVEGKNVNMFIGSAGTARTVFTSNADLRRAVAACITEQHDAPKGGGWSGRV